MQEKKALVIVDIQNGFMNQYTEHLKAKIRDYALKSVGSADEKKPYQIVIVTQYINNTMTACYNFEGWKDCMPGTESAALCEEIETLKEQIPFYLVKKDRFTCYTEEFRRILRENEITAVAFCGVNTGCCVLHSALDAYEDCVDTCVLGELCGSTNGEYYHKIGLDLLGSLISEERVLRESPL